MHAHTKIGKITGTVLSPSAPDGFVVPMISDPSKGQFTVVIANTYTERDLDVYLKPLLNY